MTVRWKDKSDITTLAAGDRIPVTDVSDGNVDKYTTPEEIATYVQGDSASLFQPLDADLTAIAALVTVTYGRSLLTLANATALAAEVDSFFLTPTEGNAAYQPLDADLTALAANGTNGFWARTGAGTGSARTITGTAAQITVTNGDGVSGAPTLSLPADMLIPAVLTVPNTGLHILDTNATHDLIIAPGSNLTADRTLTLTTGDANRTLTIGADSSISGTAYVASGTDVAIADGGTGASDATNARINLGVGLALLTSGTVSAAATLDIVLTTFTAYRGIVIKLSGFLPATDGADFWIRFSSNGGSSYDATGYNYAASLTNDAGFSGANASGSANQIAAALTIGSASTEGLNGTVEILNQTSAAFWSRVQYQIYMIDNQATPAAVNYVGGGAREAAQDTDAIRLMFSSGNISAGNYAVYGLV